MLLLRGRAEAARPGTPRRYRLFGRQRNHRRFEMATNSKSNGTSNENRSETRSEGRSGGGSLFGWAGSQTGIVVGAAVAGAAVGIAANMGRKLFVQMASTGGQSWDEAHATEHKMTLLT